MVDERVLLVEDDEGIRQVTARALMNAGFAVTTQGDGRGALSMFTDERFDVVVLDLMLPGLDGVEVCRHIRETSLVPIIMLTARDETRDVVLGLEVGADDYITKPFDLVELIARIRAILRRAAAEPPDDVVSIGDLRIDREAFRAFKGSEELELSATEFKLLDELSRNAGRVLTREVLLDVVWGYDYLGDSRLVDMAIKRLRAKVEDDPTEPRLIQTIRGIGYRIDK